MKHMAMVVSTLVALGAASPGVVSAQGAGDARPYRVIVNPENPVGLLSPRELSRLFLLKTAAWSFNGQAVLPVEPGGDSPARTAFVREIHHKNPVDITAYWEQMVFQGKASPPPTESSDSAVMDYVRQHPNAIGYVSAGTRLPADLKPITITR
jgi:ABC-type phosphate transport system substrate-binding protein